VEKEEEEEEEEEEFMQNRTRVGRDSSRYGTSTLSCNAGFDQSAEEGWSLVPSVSGEASTTRCRVAPAQISAEIKARSALL
jgi:hypothetical protein